MNVYDFDHTIYNGDSTIDFYKYILKRNPRIIMCFPFQFWSLIKYFTNTISTTKLKEGFYVFLKYSNVTDETLADFWGKARHKINPFFAKKIKNEDLIISASPEFLLSPICNILNVQLIASNVDKNTGKYRGINCRGNEKVRRFMEKFKNNAVDEFYSDSISDYPMAQISKNPFLVKRNRISPWRTEKMANFLFVKLKPLILYGVFGILTTLINIATYYGLYNWCYVSNVLSNIIAWIVAVIFAFITNKFWVFESKSVEERVFYSEFFKFITARLTTGVIDLGIMYVGVDVMHGPSTLLKITSDMIVIVLNFVFSKLLVFNKK